jgi:hypothetical protein
LGAPEEARRKYLVLLQHAGTTSADLLRAARARQGGNAYTQQALEAAARDVIEAMKKLLLATNALQVRQWQAHADERAHTHKEREMHIQPPYTLVHGWACAARALSASGDEVAGTAAGGDGARGSAFGDHYPGPTRGQADGTQTR